MSLNINECTVRCRYLDSFTRKVIKGPKNRISLSLIKAFEFCEIKQRSAAGSYCATPPAPTRDYDVINIHYTASQILQGARSDPDLLIANAINIFDHRMQYATPNHCAFEIQIGSNHGIFNSLSSLIVHSLHKEKRPNMQ
jgi:hypothetical protein